jgi:hypothetical protein
VPIFHKPKVMIEVTIPGLQAIVKALHEIKEAIVATPKELEDALAEVGTMIQDGFESLNEHITQETAQVVAAIDAAAGGDPAALDNAKAMVMGLRDSLAERFQTVTDQVDSVIPDTTPPPPPPPPPPPTV